MTDLRALKQQILDLSSQYAKIAHDTHFMASNPNRKEWVSGESIPYAARIFDEDEIKAAVNSSLDFWLTLGDEGKSFVKVSLCLSAYCFHSKFLKTDPLMN